ncbi:MAG: hypothetical protein WC551_06200 [Patescibacteria group bacterium]
MERTDAEAILRAHPEMLARGEITIFGLLMDRSGSMQRYGDTPRAVINGHIGKLQLDANADGALGFVVTFADDSRWDIPPQPLAAMPLMSSYQAEGNTKLYETVLKALRELMALKGKFLAQGVKVNLILTVFTDGEDSYNIRSIIDELVQTSGLALEAQAKLELIGIGHPAKAIARAMGFPPQDAVQIEGSEEAMHRTMAGVTQRTHITMMGCSVPSTPAPPSSH